MEVAEALALIDRTLREAQAQVMVSRSSSSSGSGSGDDRGKKRHDATVAIRAIERIQRSHKRSRFNRIFRRVTGRNVREVVEQIDRLLEASNGAKVLGNYIASRKGGRMYQIDPRIADALGGIDAVLAKSIGESLDEAVSLSGSELRRLDRARLRRRRKRFKVKASTRRKLRQAARKNKGKRRRAQKRASTVRRRLRSRRRYARLRGRSRRRRK